MTNEMHPDICKHCGAEYSLMGTTYGALVCTICKKDQNFVYGKQMSEKEVQDRQEQLDAYHHGRRGNLLHAADLERKRRREE